MAGKTQQLTGQLRRRRSEPRLTIQGYNRVHPDWCPASGRGQKQVAQGRASTGAARVQTHILRGQPLVKEKATENCVLLLRQHGTNLYYSKNNLKIQKQAITLEAGVALQFVVRTG